MEMRDKTSPLESGAPEDTCQVFSFNPVLVARIKEKLHGVAATAALFRALGDESRCTILTALTMGEELCVCDLSEVTRLAMPTVSHHLRKLKEQGLVKPRREGKLIFYRLTDEDVRLLLRIATSKVVST